MVCSCCAFGNTADQHFTAEKVAKDCGNTVERAQGQRRADFETALHRRASGRDRARRRRWLWRSEP